MEPIVFKQGEETGIVIQKEKFENSWLSDQYSAALQVVERIYRAQQVVITHNKDRKEDWSQRLSYNGSNIVAFCGDRGEGKTSCMMTVREILTNDEVRKEYKSSTAIKCDYIFEPIQLIEPAFFDSTHNIIELLLGQMFIQFNKHQIKECDSDYKTTLCLRNKVREAFSKAQNNLSILHKDIRKQCEDLENLENLAASMQLADSLRDLFAIYLKYMGKQDGRLLLCIDDIDLNMSEAYPLSEQIRKYLTNEYCVILIALKVEQLQNVITSHIAKEDDKYYVSAVYRAMAEKYIAKLLPIQNRIEMPRVEMLADKKLVLVSDKEILYPSVKEAVMTLIARKTHYLFYNKKDEVSPLIPRNLRALRHLIGILVEMKKYDYSNREKHADSTNGINKHNQEIFRNYFYKIWVNDLTKDDKEFANGLTSMPATYTINKYVVTYLRKRFAEWLNVNVFDASVVKKSELDEDNIEQIEIDVNSKKLLKNIFDSESTAYNISAGDVLYVISIFDKRFSDIDIKKLLFFIKAYYSIQLYESYNRMTETDNMLYPVTPEDTDINKEEVLFEHINAYQKFTNGSIFTFVAGEILPRYRKSDPNVISPYRDMWKISANKLYNEMVEVMQEYDKYERDSENYADKEELVQRFKRCEYLLLSSSYSSAYVMDSTDLYVDRSSLSPYYTGKYSRNYLTYLVYNPLAIFSNCANVKYTYERFGKYNAEGDDVTLTFYDYAVKAPFSLLNEMIEKVKTDREYKDLSSEELAQERLKLLASNATIRNTDIHVSILENIRERRRSIGKDSKSGLVLTLTNLYRYIVADTHINYYAKDEDDENKYAHTTFDFLNAIIDFLSGESDQSIFEDFLRDADVMIDMTYNDFMKKFDGIKQFFESTRNVTGSKILEYLSVHANSNEYIKYKGIIDGKIAKNNTYTLQQFRKVIKSICQK